MLGGGFQRYIWQIDSYAVNMQSDLHQNNQEELFTFPSLPPVTHSKTHANFSAHLQTLALIDLELSTIFK